MSLSFYLGLLDPKTETEHEHRKQQSSHYLLYTLIAQFTLIYSTKRASQIEKGNKKQKKEETCKTPDQGENV